MDGSARPSDCVSASHTVRMLHLLRLTAWSDDDCLSRHRGVLTRHMTMGIGDMIPSRTCRCALAFCRASVCWGPACETNCFRLAHAAATAHANPVAGCAERWSIGHGRTSSFPRAAWEPAPLPLLCGLFVLEMFFSYYLFGPHTCCGLVLICFWPFGVLWIWPRPSVHRTTPGLTVGLA